MRIEEAEEPTLKTRASKAWGAAAGITAIAASVPFAINAPFATNAYADPPAVTSTTEAPIPDPQGSGCDAFKTELPNWKDFSKQPVSKVLATIPDISTFTSLISGQANPAVNIVSVLDNGPYVVFAPSNDAFAAMDPAQLAATKADPAALAKLDYYHVFLGLLGPDDVHGQRPSQQGGDVKVTGKGGDIKVNDDAKVVCGGIQASDARIYIIDKVLDPSNPASPVSPSGTSSTTTTTTTTTTTSSSAEVPPPAGDQHTPAAG
ncbi:MAG: fasciclin domain-containing protein [Mycobacterium sp.]